MRLPFCVCKINAIMDFDMLEMAKRTVSRGILLELSALGLIRGDGLSGRWLKWLKRRMLHIF